MSSEVRLDAYETSSWYCPILIITAGICRDILLKLSNTKIIAITSAFLKLLGTVKGKGHPCTSLRLCTGPTAHRGIALNFLDHGTTRGWGVSVTPRSLFTSRKDPVPIVQKARWAPGPVWTRAENLAVTGIRSPDCPARSQSQYRLRYPAHKTVRYWHTNGRLTNRHGKENR